LEIVEKDQELKPQVRVGHLNIYLNGIATFLTELTFSILPCDIISSSIFNGLCCIGGSKFAKGENVFIF
jgi:hypothetical protein